VLQRIERDRRRLIRDGAPLRAGDSVLELRVTQKVEEISEATDVRCLLLAPRRFFVKPRTPNSAARWPYLRGLATAADKYEEAPHGEVRLQPEPSRRGRNAELSEC
jgi:hypothetical protein